MTTDNMRHWFELSRTDPKFTKPFTRAGGFRGTDINPTWRMMRMTERFGPVGIGWGMTEPVFEMVQEEAGRVVYCRVGIWYRDGDTKSDPVWGVGGDVVSGKRRDGGAFIDDEAQKKAFTDALGNAMKALGVSADVFLKMFDDSKYRAESEAHFSEKGKEQKAQRPTASSSPPSIKEAAVKAFEAEVKERLSTVADMETLKLLWKHETESRLEQITSEWPDAADRIIDMFAAKKRALLAEPNTVLGA